MTWAWPFDGLAKKSHIVRAPRWRRRRTAAILSDMPEGYEPSLMDAPVILAEMSDEKRTA